MGGGWGWGVICYTAIVTHTPADWSQSIACWESPCCPLNKQADYTQPRALSKGDTKAEGKSYPMCTMLSTWGVFCGFSYSRDGLRRTWFGWPWRNQRTSLSSGSSCVSVGPLRTRRASSELLSQRVSEEMDRQSDCLGKARAWWKERRAWSQVPGLSLCHTSQMWKWGPISFLLFSGLSL